MGLIRKQRKKLSYTLSHLAKICNVSSRTVGFWDAHDCVPKTKDAIIVSETLGIPVKRLADGIPFPKGITRERKSFHE